MSDKTNMMDITDLTDTQLDAAIAFRTGDNTYDFDALASYDIVAVQRATGADMRVWIASARLAEQDRAMARRAERNGRDYEGRILAHQEDGGRNVG